MSKQLQDLNKLDTQNTYTTNGEEMKSDKEKSSELVKYEHIENTPFTLVNIEGRKMLAIGNARVSELGEEEEELRKKVDTKDWGLIGAFVLKIVELELEKRIGIKKFDEEN